jgi:hypothetical protein
MRCQSPHKEIGGDAQVVLGHTKMIGLVVGANHADAQSVTAVKGVVYRCV